MTTSLITAFENKTIFYCAERPLNLVTPTPPYTLGCLGVTQLTEGCMGEQASLEFDLTFGYVLLHKLVQAY